MLKKAIDLLFYSNAYIAFCAVAMTLQTQLLLGKSLAITPLIVMVFFATLFIYALHRLMGLFKVTDFLETGRYYIINKFKSHIWVYAIISVIGCITCFFLISWRVRWALIIPGILSLGYVLPILGRGKQLRLRDYDFIKIFLVAIVWAYVTVLLPVIENGTFGRLEALMFIERTLFIFAITLPFDIRDLQVDEFVKVQTIPAVIGIPKTLQLAALLLVFFLIIAFLNYSFLTFVALSLSAISTGIFIRFSPKQKHDYYFTGLMDGTMIIQFLLMVVMS